MNDLLYSYYGDVYWLVIGWFLLIAVHISISCWAGRIARRKGYSYAGYWTLTFFFGLIGIIIAACLDNRTKFVQPTTETHDVVSKDRWQCGKCGQFNDDGLYCAKCGERRYSVNGWLCLDCLTYNDGGDFCSKCGKPKLGEKKKKEISWKCEYCGRINPIDEYQCRGCGSSREK